MSMLWMLRAYDPIENKAAPKQPKAGRGHICSTNSRRWFQPDSDHQRDEIRARSAFDLGIASSILPQHRTTVPQCQGWDGGPFAVVGFKLPSQVAFRDYPVPSCCDAQLRTSVPART